MTLHHSTPTAPGCELRSLVYSSTATHAFSEGELDALLQQARGRNERLGVTGMLSYRSGSFVQFLEGDPRHIDALLESLRADDRHRDLTVLIDEPISERQFTNWTMGYERMRPPTSPAPEGFRDTFADLEQNSDSETTARAARELTLWFTVRAGRA